MKALILAGGFGVRMREIVHGRPKHLASINGQPFLRHLLRMLKKNGVTEAVISIGYLAQYIVDEFTRNDEGLAIAFSEDDRPLGTGGSIKNAQRFFTEDFLVVNGDTYLDIDYGQLLSAHRKTRALLTIVATDQHRNKGGIVLSQDEKVTGFLTGHHDSVPQNSYRNTGVYAASSDLFERIPEFERVSLEKEIIPSSLARRDAIHAFIVHREFMDIGSFAGYAEARQKLQ